MTSPSCGVTMLAKALEHHCTLDKLDIGFNLIGDDGATAIADMLSVNDTLLTLNIDRCNISDVGLEAPCGEHYSKRTEHKL